MIKLFAVLAVLAALPVSTLAGQLADTPNGAKHCRDNQMDSVYVQNTTPAPVVKTETTAVIAQ